MSSLALSAPTAAVSLYYREGSSDKVYHAQIISTGDSLYAINFQYGRRGSTLQTGTKTAAPGSLAEAQKVFAKLVAEKRAKGYTEGEAGTPYSGSELANRRFAYSPQLLNYIDEPAMLDYLSSPDWVMQEKMDGVRQIVECRAGAVSAGNRNGLTVGVSADISDAVLALDRDCVFDGEAIGDAYWPFDLLSIDGLDITHRPVAYRLQLLSATLKVRLSAAIGHVRTAFSALEKHALLNTVRTEGGEGVVFKNAHAGYTPGRPASGGSALKHKFKASATCAVLSHNPGKRSVLLGVRDDSTQASPQSPFVEIGNVTIPANQLLPPSGDVVEVEYLYAFPGGALFQPVYKGPRTDKQYPDTYASLKFKQANGDGA